MEGKTSKAADRIFGKSDVKRLDKLGIHNKELEIFESVPKAYKSLGLGCGASGKGSPDSQIQDSVESVPERTASSIEVLSGQVELKVDRHDEGWKDGSTLSVFAILTRSCLEWFKDVTKTGPSRLLGMAEFYSKSHVSLLDDGFGFTMSEMLVGKERSSLAEGSVVVHVDSKETRDRWITNIQNVIARLTHSEQGEKTMKTNDKVSSVLFGKGKLKSEDKLGVSEKEINMFQSIPKAFKTMGMFDHDTAQTEHITLQVTGVEEKCGYLAKKSAEVVLKHWDVRYFVLRKDAISYYKQPTDQEPAGTIPLGECGSVVTASCSSPHTDYKYGFNVAPFKTEGTRVYELGAASEKERDEWIVAITNILSAYHRTIKNNLKAHSKIDRLVFGKTGCKATDKFGVESKKNELGESVGCAEIHAGTLEYLGPKTMMKMQQEWKLVGVILFQTRLMVSKGTQTFEEYDFSTKSILVCVKGDPMEYPDKHVLKVVVGKKKKILKTIMFAAQTVEERDEWIERFQLVITRTPDSPTSATSSHDRPTLQGYAFKLGAIKKNWKRRLLTLTNDQIAYFKASTDTTPAGHISLIGDISVMDPPWDLPRCPTPHVFTIVNNADPDARRYVLAVDDENEKAMWIQALTSRLESSN